MLHAEDVTGNTDTPAQEQESKVYYLNVSEAGGDKDSWTLPGNWSTVRADTKSDAEAAGGVHPESFNLPNDGFIVPADSGGYTLRTAANGSNGNSEWNGKYLQLGGIYDSKSHLAVLRLVVRGNDKTTTFNNDGLIMAGRSEMQAYYSKSTYNLHGIISVTAEDERYPAIIRQRRASPSINVNINDKFKSSSTSFARVEAQTNKFTVAFADTTEFFGKLTATNEYDDADATVILQSDFPGTISISTNTVLAPATGVKIANLKYFDGAVIDARSGTLEIIGSIVKSGKIRVLTNNFGANTTNPRFSELVKFPADAGITADDFEFVDADGDPLDCDSYNVTTDSAQGTTSITAVRYGYVELRESDNTSRTKDNPSSMTNGLNWSDGLWPTNPLVDYAAIDNNLRTFDSSDDIKQPLDDFVFKGHSLIMDDAILVVLNRSFSCGNLFLRNEATFAYTPYYNGSLYGKVTADEGNAYFSVYSYKTLTIESAIEGSGNVIFSSPGGVSTSDSRGYYVLKGNNDRFAGTMVVTMPYKMPANPVDDWKKVTPSFDRNYTTLNLTSKGNLGGKLPAVNPKAFTIESMSRVKPADEITDLTLDDETRGIFIKWVGRLFANEGQTLTVRSPLAVHGTLWKEGEGMLVLANPAPTFGEDAESTTPDDDVTNRTFRVAGGDVKIASADAVNGLDVVFTNGAGRIVLDLDSEDETFRTFGLRNTKATAPFAVEGDVSEIPVVLNFANPPEIGSSRGLVTVTSKDRNPAAKVSLLSFEKSPALYGIIVSREWVDNGNDTFTLKATFKDVGMRIVIR